MPVEKYYDDLEALKDKGISWRGRRKKDYKDQLRYYLIFRKFLNQTNVGRNSIPGVDKKIKKLRSKLGTYKTTNKKFRR